MEIINVNISDIVPYENNPRHNDKAVDIVSKSIKEYGFLVPIILDDKNIIVCGHTRLKAAIKLGLNTVPCIYAENLTEAQIRAFRIMDNKSSEYASWDLELLKTELSELKNLDIDLKLTGFSESELSSLIPDMLENEHIPDSTTPKYNVLQGDIYSLGNHRLMCGDSTNEQMVNSLMNKESINMVLTDPPYGVDYSEKNKFLNAISPGNRIQKPIKNDVDVNIRALVCDFLSLIPFSDYNTIYVFSSGKNIAEMIYSLKDAECYYSQDLKWVKNNHVLGRMDYNPKSENIIYGWKGKHEFYGGFQTDVLFFNKPLSSNLHPTMKPIELLTTLIKHGSRENSNIYDGFGGSGSTLIACEQTKRKCFIMEIDPVYCSVIIERWENLTKQKAVKIN